jgi:hypothetical protein
MIEVCEGCFCWLKELRLHSFFLSVFRGPPVSFQCDSRFQQDEEACQMEEVPPRFQSELDIRLTYLAYIYILAFSLITVT